MIDKIHASVSIISAISAEGDLCYKTRTQAFTSSAIVLFLKYFLKKYPRRKLILIWDGAGIHRSQAVKDFLTTTNRLQLYRIPPYSPELNPDEMVWKQLKKVEMKNKFCKSLRELRKEVEEGLNNINAQPKIINSFFRKTSIAYYT